jgi:hypothetical protein
MRSIRLVLAALTALTALLVANQGAAEEDACSDVLRIGFRDSFEHLTATTLNKFRTPDMTA